MVADAVLPDNAFYMLEEFAGRMANAGNPRKDQVIWNIYSDTLTYKDFEHMSYDREGNEARVSTKLGCAAHRLLHTRMLKAINYSL